MAITPLCLVVELILALGLGKCFDLEEPTQTAPTTKTTTRTPLLPPVLRPRFKISGFLSDAGEQFERQ